MNDIALSNNIIKTISNGDTYVSMHDKDSIESKMTVFNAFAKPVKMSDALNKSLKVIGIAARPSQITDIETGEVIYSMMSVIITDDGVPYMTRSNSFFNALNDLLISFGEPQDWPDNMRITPVKRQGRTYEYLTLNVEMI